MKYQLYTGCSVQERIKTRGLAMSLFLVCSTLCAQDYPETITVQGGSFIMGDESGDQDEKPAHQVVVKHTAWQKRKRRLDNGGYFAKAQGDGCRKHPGLDKKVNILW
jgi:formylglycine-generating enzyme required for sulfatase activity